MTLSASFKKILATIFYPSCAGGICIRERKGGKELLCIMKKSGKIVLPKGRRRWMESLAQTAIREVQEETGLSNFDLGRKLGTIIDTERRKKITFFLIHIHSFAHSDIKDEAIVWMDINHDLDRLKHSSEREFIDRYLSSSGKPSRKKKQSQQYI